MFSPFVWRGRRTGIEPAARRCERADKLLDVANHRSHTTAACRRDRRDAVENAAGADAILCVGAIAREIAERSHAEPAGAVG